MDMKNEFEDSADNLNSWEKPGEISTAALDAMITQMREIEADYDAKKKIASEAAIRREKARGMVLAALQAAGKTKYFTEGLGTVYTISKYVVRVPKDIESKKLFLDYIRSLGDEFYLEKVGVNHQTLQGLYNSLKDEANSKGDASFQIPGLTAPTLQESVGFRKSK